MRRLATHPAPVCANLAHALVGTSYGAVMLAKRAAVVHALTR